MRSVPKAPSQAIRNPYSAGSPRWEGHEPRILSDLVPVGEPIHTSVRERSGPLYREIWLHIELQKLLEEARVPLSRRYIQAVLTFERGYSPRTVNELLVSLERMDESEVQRTELKVHGEQNFVYHLRPPKLHELSKIESLIEYRQAFLRREILGPVGERFVRSCLKWTGRFLDVTPLSKVGYVSDKDSKNKIDLMATDKQSGIRYAISVKNRNEWLYPGDSSIKDVWIKAEAHNAMPWIIVPFASDGAIKRCAENPKTPIRLSAIGAQVLPPRIDGNSTLSVLSALTPLIGPQPFIFSGGRFDPRPIPRAFIRSILPIGNLAGT